jgi:subtilisin family serine protease
MKETYMVLRVKGAAASGLESIEEFGITTRGAEGSAERAADLEVSCETPELDDQDYKEMRRDREVKGIARPIPIDLIRPVSAREVLAAPANLHGATWGVYVTGALQSPRTGVGVTVAVLDTGIDSKHAAFEGVELTEKDFTGEGNGDDDGHGTHVAGTIFGRTIGDVRYSVAPGVSRALIGKIIGAKRSATTKEIVDAIQWAVEKGAHVINMSVSFNFPKLVKTLTAREGLKVELATSRALAMYRDNVRYFDQLVGFLKARTRHANGAVLVAAAGNESKRDENPKHTIDVMPPAAADGMVAVAALRSVDPAHKLLEVASFSNVRATVSAPGVGIYSAKSGGGYIHNDGTSMASPHVAGVAALWAERQIKLAGEVNPDSLAAQVRGNARLDRLGQARYLDVGDGLVLAPTD